MRTHQPRRFGFEPSGLVRAQPQRFGFSYHSMTARQYRGILSLAKNTYQQSAPLNWAVLGFWKNDNVPENCPLRDPLWKMSKMISRTELCAATTALLTSQRFFHCRGFSIKLTKLAWFHSLPFRMYNTTLPPGRGFWGLCRFPENARAAGGIYRGKGGVW